MYEQHVERVAPRSKSRMLRLNPGEVVLCDELPSPFWTMAVYFATWGFWAIWRRRHHLILTNQRVAVVKGILNKSEQSVPLARIQDVNLKRSIITGGYVCLSSAGGSLGVEQLGPLTRERARQFADAISGLLSGTGDGVSGVDHVGGGANRSVVDQLERLAALRNSGALTDDEFTREKARLLGTAAY